MPPTSRAPGRPYASTRVVGSRSGEGMVGCSSVALPLGSERGFCSLRPMREKIGADFSTAPSKEMETAGRRSKVSMMRPARLFWTGAAATLAAGAFAPGTSAYAAASEAMCDAAPPGVGTMIALEGVAAACCMTTVRAVGDWRAAVGTTDTRGVGARLGAESEALSPIADGALDRAPALGRMLPTGTMGTPALEPAPTCTRICAAAGSGPEARKRQRATNTGKRRGCFFMRASYQSPSSGIEGRWSLIGPGRGPRTLWDLRPRKQFRPPPTYPLRFQRWK